MVIAALIGANCSVKTLRLANNPLRDEGIVPIARAIRSNDLCKLTVLDVSNTKFGVEGGKELAWTVAKMGSLRSLDVTNNRLCGVWVDQYGQQGKWSADAVLAMADAIRNSATLDTLLIGGNRIRDEGIHAIVGALRDDPEIVHLGLENNEIGAAGAMKLATAVGAMIALEDVNLSHNCICGAASVGGRPPTPYSAAGMSALVEGARVSSSLRRLNLSNNRICGQWSDAYGGQLYGTYDTAGAEAISDLLRTREGSTLTELDISNNSLGPVGGRAIYEALRENDGCPIKLLNLRNSRFDPPTERFLLEISQVSQLTLEM